MYIFGQNGESEAISRLRLHIRPLFCFVPYWTTKTSRINYKPLETNLGAFVVEKD